MRLPAIVLPLGITLTGLVAAVAPSAAQQSAAERLPADVFDRVDGLIPVAIVSALILPQMLV